MAIPERFHRGRSAYPSGCAFCSPAGLFHRGENPGSHRHPAGNLEHISAERIQAELVKLAVSPHPEEFYTVRETGISRVILPEFDEAMETPQNNPHHCYTVGRHMIESMRQIEPDKVLRLTMLFHDIGKPVVRSTGEDGVDHFFGHADVSAQMARDILKRLKFDNETLNTVENSSPTTILPHPNEIREKVLNKVGKGPFPAGYEGAAGRCRSPERLSAPEKEERILGGGSSRKDLRGEAVLLPERYGCHLLDLIADGMKPGKISARS